MAPYAAREPVEVFWLLALNAKHRVIRGAPEAITRGLVDESLVHPREVFLSAFVAGATMVVLCHNHPSGDPTPSAEDRAVTTQLVAAGRLLGVPVLDHVIVGHDRYLSFAEEGLL
jgi:DNA repair protein RadC